MRAQFGAGRVSDGREGSAGGGCGAKFGHPGTAQPLPFAWETTTNGMQKAQEDFSRGNRGKIPSPEGSGGSNPPGMRGSGGAVLLQHTDISHLQPKPPGLRAVRHSQSSAQIQSGSPWDIFLWKGGGFAEVAGCWFVGQPAELRCRASAGRGAGDSALVTARVAPHRLRAQGSSPEELLSQAEVIKTNTGSWEGRMGSQTSVAGDLGCLTSTPARFQHGSGISGCPLSYFGIKMGISRTLCPCGPCSSDGGLGRCCFCVLRVSSCRCPEDPTGDFSPEPLSPQGSFCLLLKSPHCWLCSWKDPGSNNPPKLRAGLCTTWIPSAQWRWKDLGFSRSRATIGVS